MNFNSFKVLSIEKRINHWQQMREKSLTLPLLERYEYVSRWWNSLSSCNWTVDPNDAYDWFNPYEMLTDDLFCKNAIAIGIIHTLYYKSKIDYNLLMIKTSDNQYFYVVTDGEYVINYSETPIKIKDMNARVLYYRTFDGSFSDKKYNNKGIFNADIEAKRSA